MATRENIDDVVRDIHDRIGEASLSDEGKGVLKDIVTHYLQMADVMDYLTDCVYEGATCIERFPLDEHEWCWKCANAKSARDYKRDVLKIQD